MDLTEYRNSPIEKQRLADLMNLVPTAGATALDVGARDGFVSKLLCERFEVVTALDLEKPAIDHERVVCVKGDVTALEFGDASFDLVFCAEVLEHIPTKFLEKACKELARVSKGALVIGVPYRQDTRVGRLTCNQCGKISPPWGHVNNFDEQKLASLFPGCDLQKQSFVGSSSEQTNAFSSTLMDWAGNPFGSYAQEEPCIHCGASFTPPPQRTLLQKILTKTAFVAVSAQRQFVRPHANWIHQQLRKRPGSK
jgi:Methyltransferase domain